MFSGGLAVVMGEAGLGKTHVVHHAIENSLSNGRDCIVHASADAMSKSSFMHVWKIVLEELLYLEHRCHSSQPHLPVLMLNE